MKKRTLEEMPQFLSSVDLIELGIYLTADLAYLARKNGWSPPFIKLKHKVLYPKDLLIEWLKERTHGAIEVPELDRV